MKSLLPVVFIFMISHLAVADVTIFDMRKTLAMAANDPVFHDYYLNGGSEAGLVQGMVITVTRKLPLYDTYQNHSAGDLHLKVAKVRIIQVQRGLAVARLISDFSRENSPLLEDPYIMIGDVLDLSTATHDGKKESSASASNNEESEERVEARAPVAGKPVAQISVNSVDVTAPFSSAPSSVKIPSSPAKPSAAVDSPKLQ